MQYDIASKVIVEEGKEAMFRHFQKRLPVEMELLESLPQELPSLKKGDYLLRVRDVEGREEIQVWEFKTEWRQEDILSLMDYAIRARLTYHLPVVPIMYLFKENQAATGEYKDDRFHFTFELIKMWEEDGRALFESGDYFLYPFIPIMKEGEDLTLEAEKKLYNSKLERGDKAELLTAMVLFAGMKDIRLYQKLIERRRDIMIESPAYELLMQMAREDVRKEVQEDIRKEVQEDIRREVQEDVRREVQEDVRREVQEKIREKVQESVLAVLDERFVTVPYTVRESLKTVTDLTKLDLLLKKAVTTGSVEEFSACIINDPIE